MLRSTKFTMFSPWPVNFQLHVKGLGVDDLLIIIKTSCWFVLKWQYFQGVKLLKTMKEIHYNLE